VAQDKPRGNVVIVRLLVALLVVAAVIAVGYMLFVRDDFPSVSDTFPVGDCVDWSNPDSDHLSISGGNCSGPYAYLIVAYVNDPALCTPGDTASPTHLNTEHEYVCLHWRVIPSPSS
jgi:hypothetical protein